MDNFKHIQHKLEEFIRKYYTNELIKGALLFFALGLLYFFTILLVEYAFWLSPAGRTLLFWIFVTVELYFFIRFVAYPLGRLLKLQKGIGYEEASDIIGRHFPEVNDKLLNLLQLRQGQGKSELLIASIEQKSAELRPIPFQKAVNFRKNVKYLKYAVIPVLVYFGFSLSGNSDIFSSSYERVLNYKTAYEPPAPFSFYVINDELTTVENKPFALNVRVAGKILPETVSIAYEGENYFLEQVGPGEFRYIFRQPSSSASFRLKGNAVTSKEYLLEVIKAPSMVSFEMGLQYPSYTGKGTEVLKGTGNATIPEGTVVNWKVRARQTETVKLKTEDAVYPFAKNDSGFDLQRPVMANFRYEISTSNRRLKDYENLSFRLDVVKDQFPDIAVESKKDSTDAQTTYIKGRVSDDYGLTKLRLVYFPSDKEEAKTMKEIPVSASNFDEFLYVFPGNLKLEEGTTYSYYFEIFDNDGVNGAKSTRSATFSFRVLMEAERERELLKEQQETIKGLDKSLEKFEEQKRALEELSKTQKEKSEMSWNDKQKLEEFLKRQKQQEKMMKDFSEKMKNNLENFQKENKEPDPFKEELKERLDENEKKQKENEDLLKELEKLKEKIQNEELIEKLEKLGKQNKNQKRNLEQLLELTKRYYVEKKAEKLASELEKLAEKQEKISEKSAEQNTAEKQEELNKEFEKFQKEKEELLEENEKLKQPMEIPDNSQQEEEVAQEQKKAKEKLDKQQQEDATKNQKKAAEKMKEMSMSMKMQMAMGGSQGEEEDMEMLRQILDNLVTFSLSQEDLMASFKITNYGNPLYGQRLVRQNELKQNFRHIDDSLFSLALRNPMVGTKINELIGDVQYNMDKSLEELAENRLRSGVAFQQYTVTNANELAVLLGDALNSMQMQMQMAGSGKSGQGSGFQLPDIIKQQESLNEKMEKGTKPGKEGEGQEGEGEGDGEGDPDGSGKEGEGSDGEGSDGNTTGKDGDRQGEEMNGLLFEIYQQQQLLRMQLEDRLREEGLPADARELIDKMETVEQELLEKGFNEQTLKKMNELKHQLMKLDKAVFQQGEDESRRAQTNTKEYENTVREQQLKNARDYFNNREILNRKALPLRQDFQIRVREYFKETND